MIQDVGFSPLYTCTYMFTYMYAHKHGPTKTCTINWIKNARWEETAVAYGQHFTQQDGWEGGEVVARKGEFYLEILNVWRLIANYRIMYLPNTLF